MSNVRHRIVFGVLLVVLGAAAFLVASAFVVDHGYNKIIAGVVGALVFPVLPAVWQFFGERRRARKRAEAKKPAKSTLTGADRYWVRFGIVAVAAIGPMIYYGGAEVLRATVKHATWYIPEPVPGIGGIGLGHTREFPDQESLLRRVPSDAEAVVLWHDAAEPRDIVIAYGGKQAMGVGRPTFPRATFDQAAKALAHWLPLEPLSVVPNTDGLELQSTDGWRAKVDPPAGALPPEIRRELARAAADAFLAVGFAPHTQPVAQFVKAGALWARMEGDHAIVEFRIDAHDVAAAAAILGGARDALAGHAPASVPSACGAAVAKLGDDVEVEQIGIAVIAHATLSAAELGELAQCVP